MSPQIDVGQPPVCELCSSSPLASCRDSCRMRSEIYQMENLVDLIADVELRDAGAQREMFAHIVSRGMILLCLEDRSAAAVFETTRDAVRRWRGGMMPPIAGVVLKFMRKDLEKKIAATRTELYSLIASHR